MVQFEFFPMLVVRTPALSYRDYAAALANLQEILNDSYFRSAIFFASKDLHNQLVKARYEAAHLSKRQIVALQHYINRVHYRQTPFGLFGIVASTRWNDDTQIRVCGSKIHIMPGFEELANGKAASANSSAYYINRSLYPVGNSLRFLSCDLNNERKGFEFSIRSIQRYRLFSKLQTFLREPVPLTEIERFIAENTRLSTNEARSITNDLVELNILIDSRHPNITGDDYFTRSSSEENAHKILHQSDGPGSTLAANLVDEPDPGKSYYVNLMGSRVDGGLNKRYQTDLLDALHCLGILNAGVPACARRENFIERFNKKLEGQLLPLLYVLDPETGVGYGDLEVADGTDDDDEIGLEKEPARTPSIKWSGAHALLLKKWTTNVSNRSPICISKTDLEGMPDAPDQMPPSTLSVMFRTINEKLLIENVGGYTANALIGRFTPFDNDIYTQAKAIAKHEMENDPDVAFAEIAHICDFHTANVNRRRALYDYEIPVLTTPGVPWEQQIGLADLYVTVIGGKIILNSKKLGKRVIPRLSSAFNHNRNNLSVFRFLCDLQGQDLACNFTLNLADYFPGCDFYPRVEYGNSILHLATWRIPPAELRLLPGIPEPQQLDFLAELRERLGLPPVVVLCHHDHQLIFNLERQEEALLFITSVKPGEVTEVKECLTLNETEPAVVNHNGKAMANQFVAALYHTSQVYCGPASMSATGTTGFSNRRPPGDQWLYFKLYCHSSQANALIVNTLGKLSALLFKNNLVESWFFVRYYDPEHHIRYRIKLSTGATGNAMETVCKHLNRLIGREIIHKYAVDTYEQETFRYGRATLPAFEELFYRSSGLIVCYIKTLIHADGIDTVEIAAMAVHEVFDAIGLSSTDRIIFMKKIIGHFKYEFANVLKLEYKLDQVFRKRKHRLRSLLTSAPASITGTRTNKYRNVFLNQVKQLLGTAPVERQSQWLADIIHMHLNRLFANSSRRQEFVVYYMLLKYEQSKVASVKGTLLKADD